MIPKRTKWFFFLSIIWLAPNSHAKTSTFFSLKPIYDSGSVIYQDESYEITSLAGQLEIGFRINSLKLSFYGYGQSSPAKVDGESQGTFLYTGGGVLLRAFFFQPIFIEGGGGQHNLKYTTDAGAIAEDQSSNILVGMGAEANISKNISLELAVRNQKASFTKAVFENLTTFQVLTGINIYF